MPKTTPQAQFPFDKNSFGVTLFETGNAPDYSTIYNQGIQAGRGASEGYTITNCPKGDPITTVEITGNSGSDIMKYNYMKIDYAFPGDGTKWYFITKKRLLNYPDPLTSNWIAVEFTIELDVWETYKDRLGNPMIQLDQVTTNNPAAWADYGMAEQDILPYSGESWVTSPTTYSNWKPIVGWQADKPNVSNNYIIDGMRTTMKFNGDGSMTDFVTDITNLSTTSTPEEATILQTYVVCNCYVVSEYFATDDGGTSAPETLTASSALWTGHNRLNYYPYRRAFIYALDGQFVEIDPNKFTNGRIPNPVTARVTHSTLPVPTSVICPNYDINPSLDAVIFKSYPAMDIAGKDITPISQIFETGAEAVRRSSFANENFNYYGGSSY